VPERLRPLALIASLVVGLPVAAWTQTRDENWSRCSDMNPDLSIGACTALIQSGKETTDNLVLAFSNRGASYARNRDYDRAFRDFDQAIRLNPNSERAIVSRGVIYGLKGDNDHSLQDYDHAIRLNPKSAIALDNRCLLRAAMGRGQEALADCDASLRINPTDTLALTNRGHAYLALKDYDAALSAYEVAVKADPVNPFARFGRGVAKLRKGDVASGNADITAAKVLQADVADWMAKHGVKP